MLALFTGSLYGGTHTISGHPLDTIKSKMQIQQGYNGGAMEVTRMIYKAEGLRGFYRGCIPPLWGSMIYRGIMMSACKSHCSVRCIGLKCVVLRCVGLHCTLLDWIAPHCAAPCCIALRRVAMRCNAMHCIRLRCAVMHCIALHWIALCYIALLCTALH
jgi:hypothetical protein